MDDLAAATRRKRARNGWYVWAMHWLHLVLDALPAPLRRWCWRPLLGACGEGVMIDHRVYFKFPRLVYLGNDVSINRGVEFYPGRMQRAAIHVGDRVRLAPNVRIHAAGHDPDSPDLADMAAPVRIEDDAWIGAAAVLLPGVTIGRGAVVAAGAVVSRDVAAGTIVGGIPARFIRHRAGAA